MSVSLKRYPGCLVRVLAHEWILDKEVETVQAVVSAGLPWGSWVLPGPPYQVIRTAPQAELCVNALFVTQ